MYLIFLMKDLAYEYLSEKCFSCLSIVVILFSDCILDILKDLLYMFLSSALNELYPDLWFFCVLSTGLTGVKTWMCLETSKQTYSNVRCRI